MKRLEDLNLDEPVEVNAWLLPHPPSSLAEPRITVEEANLAEVAICRWHKGRIGHARTSSDAWDKVYFCPIGHQYWRLTPLHIREYSWIL